LETLSFIPINSSIIPTFLRILKVVTPIRDVTCNYSLIYYYYYYLLSLEMSLLATKIIADAMIISIAVMLNLRKVVIC